METRRLGQRVPQDETGMGQPSRVNGGLLSSFKLGLQW
jgi:hypothetical protein